MTSCDGDNSSISAIYKEMIEINEYIIQAFLYLAKSHNQPLWFSGLRPSRLLNYTPSELCTAS